MTADSAAESGSVSQLLSGNATYDRAGCEAECGKFIRDYFASHDTEVVVSTLPRLVPSPYVDLNMTCPHGVTWHTEPTSDQQARWAREGIR